jgi:hypothetical protein
MKLAIDIDTMKWRNPVALSSPLSIATMRREDSFPVDIIATRGGKPVELPGDATGKLQLNLQGEFGGTGLAADSAFEKLGQGVEAVYRFELDLSGSAVDTAFSGDPSSVNAILEFQLTSQGFTESTEPLSVTVQNSVIQS